MDEDYIQKAAELLLKGAKMLNLNCPICQNPILKMRNEEMYCVKCNKSVIFDNGGKSMVSQNVKDSSLQDRINKKIDGLLLRLESEEDPSEIAKISEAIKKLKELT